MCISVMSLHLFQFHLSPFDCSYRYGDAIGSHAHLPPQSPRNWLAANPGSWASSDSMQQMYVCSAHHHLPSPPPPPPPSSWPPDTVPSLSQLSRSRRQRTTETTPSSRSCRS